MVVSMRSHQVLGCVVGIAVLSACAPGPPSEWPFGTAGAASERSEFVSRPDLNPPIVTMTGPGTQQADDGYYFVAPKDDWNDDDDLWAGGLILDEEGSPVWIDEGDTRKYGFRVQNYADEPVLTWWEGDINPPVALGEIVLMDNTYEEIARVSVGGDLEQGTTDVHEMTITDDDTLLLLAYVPTQTDLSEIGGAEDGWVYEDVVQEVDIDTGEVLFQWRSLDGVPVTAAKTGISDDKGTKDNPFDYLHLNSVTVDDDGSLLLSARSTHAVYNLDRDTGDIQWVLGGKDSDFELDPDAVFGAQHDAHRQSDGTITMFDNRASEENGDSRGLRLDLDMDAMTASVVTEYSPPEKRWAVSQGNLQELDGGDVVVGWGSEPYFSRYDSDGELLLEGSIPMESNYRAFFSDWEAAPTEPPVAVLETSGDSPTVHVSWNGATEVESWRVRSGQDEADATEVALVERDGFETAIPLDQSAPYVEVQAMDVDGNELATVVVPQ